MLALVKTRRCPNTFLPPILTNVPLHPLLYTRRRKGGHIYAPVPLPPLQQHHDQKFYPAPASDNQMDDAFVNQQDIPSAILEDARGSTVPLDEGGGEQQQQEQHPETFGDEPSAEPSAAVETAY